MQQSTLLPVLPFCFGPVHDCLAADRPLLLPQSTNVLLQ